MQIKIWQVTSTDNLKTRVIDNVSNIEISPTIEFYDDDRCNNIKALDGFELKYVNDGKEHKERISENSTFKFKDNIVEIEINDY